MQNNSLSSKKRQNSTLFSHKNQKHPIDYCHVLTRRWKTHSMTPLEIKSKKSERINCKKKIATHLHQGARGGLHLKFINSINQRKFPINIQIASHKFSHPNGMNNECNATLVCSFALLLMAYSSDGILQPKKRERWRYTKCILLGVSTVNSAICWRFF